MEPISLRMPKELIKEIDKEAQSEERSRPQQVRIILKKHFEKDAN